MHTMLLGDYMVESVLISVGILLALIGLSDVLHKLWMSFFKDDDYVRIQLVRLNNCDGVKQVICVLQELRWHGKEFADKIICIYSQLDDDVLAKCKSLCEHNDDFVFCNLNEIEEILK